MPKAEDTAPDALSRNPQAKEVNAAAEPNELPQTAALAEVGANAAPIATAAEPPMSARRIAMAPFFDVLSFRESLVTNSSPSS